MLERSETCTIQTTVSLMAKKKYTHSQAKILLFRHLLKKELIGTITYKCSVFWGSCGAIVSSSSPTDVHVTSKKILSKKHVQFPASEHKNELAPLLEGVLDSE